MCFEQALPAVLRPPHSGVVGALPAPVAVHRLDNRVSGLVVVAKTRAAARFLSAEFRERRVEKRYRGIVVGRVAQPRQEVSVPLDGRDARTTICVVDETPHVQAGWLTTVDLFPHTGRRHQLRRHCAALGHGLLGDDLHAAPNQALHKRSGGLFLQSVEVRVRHPEVDGTWAHATIPEARKFERQRERALMGWEFEEQRRRATG